MKKNTITIRVRGEDEDGNKFKPTNTDISDLKKYLDDVEKLISADLSKLERGKISVEYYENCLALETHIENDELFQSAKDELELLYKDESSINNISKERAKVIEGWQKICYDNNISFEATYNGVDRSLQISKETNYVTSEDIWVDAEIYLYGQITDIGGKSRPNIHIDTEEYGNLKVRCEKEQLKEDEVNRLYKDYGIRVRIRQNLDTGELDNPHFIEFVDYNRKPTKDSLEEFIEKSTPYWKEIKDADKWVKDIRGDDE